MATVDPRRFIDALYALEQNRDVEPLAALYAPDADISNPVVQHKYRGQDGARDFWRTYRSAFDTVKSSFHHVVADADCAILEWTTTGTFADGKPFEYRGTSVIEQGGEGIRAFRTYFDPRRLGEQVTSDPAQLGRS